jgi:hypothetical protein
MVVGAETSTPNFELIRQALREKRGRQGIWTFRASAVHHRRVRPTKAPSPPRDAGCAHARRVHDKPHRVIQAQ